VFVAAFYLVCRIWSQQVQVEELLSIGDFVAQPLAPLVLFTLLMIAIFGGMFVVPLYAFLTTKVDPSEASRTVAANNIVNSGAMVIGSLVALGLSAINVPLVEQLLLSAVMCLVSAWLGYRLYAAEKPIPAAAE
jgi:MFS family permease